jgi:hypothetical protein
MMMNYNATMSSRLTVIAPKPAQQMSNCQAFELMLKQLLLLAVVSCSYKERSYSN